MYNNYHKHTHKSNIFSPDTHIDIESYMLRMRELGHTNYFTTEHGFGGDIFEARKYCDKYGFKCIFGIEAYMVKDNKSNDNGNYHIIIIAKTNKARRLINLLNSDANEFGFYYKPRWSLSDVLSLPSDEVYITTACVGGIASNDEAIDELFLPIADKFGRNFFLEINHNNNETQNAHNKKLLALSDKHNIQLIHANDSHYIYPSEHIERAEMLKGKNISYGFEDDYILDYPSEDEIIEAYRIQDIIPYNMVLSALQNTLIMSNAEGIDINKEIKMPTIYKNMPIEKKHQMLKDIINERFKKDRLSMNDADDIARHIDAVRFEFDIIEKTAEAHTVDYFLLNEKCVDVAINKYNGKLSKTARGSGVSFYINKLLGFTEIDRLKSPIPLFPTRFMSVSRILESRSMPDFDFNTVDPEPFIKATKDLLGEHSCYPMIAYGTMKESEAFRNTCRAMKLEHEEYNHVAKNLSEHINDDKWRAIIEKSRVYLRVVTDMKRHPCAVLLSNDDIRAEIGLVRTKTDLVCVIDSNESDEWKYLKNDYLYVTVWDIIYKVCELANIPVPTIDELDRQDLQDVFQLYSDGMTSTVNQLDGSWATDLVKKYKPKNIAELSAFVAAIRPGFASLLNGFISRIPYTTGVRDLDKVLADSYHYMIYQESIMKYLVWLGIEEDVTYSIIKKIAKKTFKEEELSELKLKLAKNWLAEVKTMSRFDETWQVVEDASRYSFNSAHACAYAYDGLYCAYLKRKYPLEYFTTVFNIYKDDLSKTDSIESELSYFDITLEQAMFGKSIADYTFDKDSRTIFKGMQSIKYINESTPSELYQLSTQQFDTFVDLLYAIYTETSANQKQIDILIKLNFFKQFGEIGYLMKVHNLFTEFWSSPSKRYKKQISKSYVDEQGWNHDIFLTFGVEKPKTYTDIFMPSVINELSKSYDKVDFYDMVKFQQEYLGHISLKTGKEKDFKRVCILEIRGSGNKKWVKTYSLGNGKCREYRAYAGVLGTVGVGDMAYIVKDKECPKIHYRGLDDNGKPIYEHDPVQRELLIERIIK